MNWILLAVVAVVLCGAAAGTILVVKNPAFWVGLFFELAKSILPVIQKRNSPEIEKRMQECARRGGEWDNFRKKCRYK